ncbi:hypothetical protein EVAR_81624_1 [Eumeta japonica]|uniref:Uncharacterized protein n=1 Tax=Eumeta variegata TaxID=151549 RepID=A0A4C1WFY9_EUMVA|nr:hypothetical protein EVAR_81624_1 [Eumeta japonica]
MVTRSVSRSESKSRRGSTSRPVKSSELARQNYELSERYDHYHPHRGHQLRRLMHENRRGTTASIRTSGRRPGGAGGEGRAETNCSIDHVSLSRVGPSPRVARPPPSAVPHVDT